MFCTVSRDLNNSPFSPTNQKEADYPEIEKTCIICEEKHSEPDYFCSKECFDIYRRKRKLNIMELFESLAQALKPPKVELNNKVTYCRNCMVYRDDKGNEIPQRLTNRFCNTDCYKEFNK